MIKLALIASFIYGFKVPPKKILTVSGLTMFYLTNFRILFNIVMISPYYYVAKIDENLGKEVLSRQ